MVHGIGLGCRGDGIAWRTPFPILLAASAALVVTSGFALAQGDRSSCYCRYFGKYFAQGAKVCMATPNGMRMARCTMSLNNTSWEITEESCPLARRHVPASTRLARAIAPDPAFSGS